MLPIYHLARARASERSSGVPIPTVWRKLKASTVQFRRGQLHLVASGPGVGKSVFALTLAVRSGVSGIYLSADSDSATQYARAVSMLTGELVGEVQRKMERGETADYDQELAQLNRLRFDFNAGPTLADVEDAVLAYGHIHYRYPELLVLDNLANVVDESGKEGYQALEDTLAYMHELARKTKTCVLVLHHLTGLWEDGTEPAPLSGLRGKVSKLPELILNLYRDESQFGAEDLGVAVVKNRGGQASAAGKQTVTLAMDLERMSILDGDDEDPWALPA